MMVFARFKPVYDRDSAVLTVKPLNEEQEKCAWAVQGWVLVDFHFTFVWLESWPIRRRS